MSPIVKISFVCGDGMHILSNDEMFLYWCRPLFNSNDEEYMMEDYIAANQAIEQWLFDTYGPGGRWPEELALGKVKWHASNQKYYFVDQAYRDHFVLRWSQ